MNFLVTCWNRANAISGNKIQSQAFFIWDRRTARSLATKSRQSTVWLRFRSILVQTFGLYRFNRRPRDLFYHDRVRLWLLRMNNEYIMIFGTIELYIFRLFSSVFERSMERRIISISDDPKVTWWSVTVLSTRDQTTDVTIQFFCLLLTLGDNNDSFIISIQD